MKKPDNYTWTHLHTMYSNGVTNIDSITDYKEYIDYAKKLGMTAICFTEHGNVFSWLHKKEYAEKQGLKYIHGMEAYITETLDEKIRDNYHCVLIAKNYDGVKEINQLSSQSFNREDNHFYYMPRISFDELVNTSDNVIICTACLASILNHGTDSIKEKFIAFLMRNKHRCYLEIQHHNVEDQIVYNKYLYNLHKETGIPLIVGTDTHALNDIHMEGRAILQKAKNVHFASEDKWDLTVKSVDELVDAYKKQNSLPMDVVYEAINNTNVIAKQIEEFDIDRNYKYPHLWEDPESEIWAKIRQGVVRRGIENYPNYGEYLKRIDYEMDTYKHNGAIDFMLLMVDVLDWCRENGIYIGYGRGSVNGSVIAWLLGITEMDSIKHNLNFERFLNRERVSLSDIDSDIPPSDIERVKQYLYNRHGLYCSDIITFNTISDKGAIRDVGRALEIPLPEVDDICKLVDNEKSYAKARKQYPELFRYVDLVKGTIVSIGSHPCGTIVADAEISDIIGVCSTSTSNYRISQINMKEVDSLNYVKLDLLKLDTIELINDTCKLANIERITPDNIDVNDDRVWDSIREDTTGIFQWEQASGSDYIKKLMNPITLKRFRNYNRDLDRMTLFSIGNSAIRPAGASYRDDLAQGKVRLTGCKPIDDFLKPTFGYLVFQEQIISFLHEYCGFTMGQADIIRRGFAKKTGTDQYIPIIKNGGYMPNDVKHEKHIPGYIANMKERYGIPKEKSEEDITAFIQVIEDASNYLFSLNHSQPYSYEGYVSGWLREYYPLEFLTVALNINSDKEAKTKALIDYCGKVGIKIVSPRFRYSQAGYLCDKNTRQIYKGIGSIKHLNDTVANELYELRNNKYEDFVDLLYDIKYKTSTDSKQRDILINIGFFEEFGDINLLKYITVLFDAIANKKNIKRDKAEELGLSADILARNCERSTDDRVDEIDYKKYIADHNIDFDYSDCTKSKKNPEISTKKVMKKLDLSEEDKLKYATKIVKGQFINVNPRAILKEVLNVADIPEITATEIIRLQMTHLGYIDYVNKNIDIHFIAVTDLNTRYAPKFKGRCLKNGQICEFKVRNKWKKDKTDTLFKENPFQDGDILEIIKCKREAKMKKIDDKWTKTDELEWWLTTYELANGEKMIDLYKYTEKEKDALAKSMTILIDTREQENSHILKYFDQRNIPYKTMKLDYGDYSFMIPKNDELGISRDLYFDKHITLERKGSLEELSGNLTKDRDRLKKEFTLAPKNKVMVIENGTYKNMVDGNYDTKYNSKSYWASFHSFWHEYDLPIVFMPDKTYTGLFIRGFFSYYFKKIILR